MWIYSLPGTLDGHEADLDRLWALGAGGLEERDGAVRAYFAERVALPAHAPWSFGKWTEERDEDWQEGWKKDLRPVRAGRVTVAPPWLAQEVEQGQLPLLIEVGMAFGTGHHATTKMAVETLGELPLTGARVLDVGTGSGVLALAAALLGATEVLGVDIDPVTIPAANDNARLNGFVPLGGAFQAPAGGTVAFVEGTLGDVAPSAPFDVVVANLYAELHGLLADQYREVVRAGGWIVLTGILTEKLPLVRGALSRHGLRDVQVRADGDWALVTARA